MVVDIKIINEKLRDNFPTYATQGSAALDLRAAVDKQVVVTPGDVELIPTGFAISINRLDFAAIILPRSGLGHKDGVVLGNTVGLIDSDYVGEIMVSVLNRNKYKVIRINPWDRIAQMAFVPVVQAQFNIVDNLTPTARGEGGFGSTGIS